MASRSRCSTRLRNVTRSRVNPSAQCRSSRISSTGLAWASSASMPSTAPNSCCCARPGISSPGRPPLSRSGSRRDSTGLADRASSSGLPGDGPVAASRSASASGRYGTVPASSAQRPDMTPKPRSRAPAASSVTSRVLPTPASPLTSAATGRPAAAASSRPSSRPSSASLPTSRPRDISSTRSVSQPTQDTPARAA